MAIKITKKLLKDYAKIQKEIPLLKSELSILRTTDAGLGNSVILDYKKGYPRPQSIVGFDKERYEHKEKLLAHKEQQCAAVEKFIADIDDTLTRLVFYKRYIEDKKWEVVAAEVGYGNNLDYVRIMIRDAYLKKLSIK